MSLSAEVPSAAPPSPRCPACGREHTNRSRRSGYRETIVLRMLGRAPWRCRDCGLRFTAPSEAEIESGRRHRTLAGYLGIRDPKERHRLNQRLLGLIAAISALFLALGLLRYCASDTRPPEPPSGSTSAPPPRAGAGPPACV